MEEKKRNEGNNQIQYVVTEKSGIMAGGGKKNKSTQTPKADQKTVKTQ